MDLYNKIRNMRERQREIQCSVKGIKFIPLSEEFIKQSDEIRHKLAMAQLEEIGFVTNKV